MSKSTATTTPGDQHDPQPPVHGPDGPPACWGGAGATFVLEHRAHALDAPAVATPATAPIGVAPSTGGGTGINVGGPDFHADHAALWRGGGQYQRQRHQACVGQWRGGR